MTTKIKTLINLELSFTATYFTVKMFSASFSRGVCRNPNLYQPAGKRLPDFYFKAASTIFAAKNCFATMDSYCCINALLHKHTKLKNNRFI